MEKDQFEGWKGKARFSWTALKLLRPAPTMYLGLAVFGALTYENLRSGRWVAVAIFPVLIMASVGIGIMNLWVDPALRSWVHRSQRKNHEGA